jgi:DNA-binding MarR family transcriptional regulator
MKKDDFIIGMHECYATTLRKASRRISSLYDKAFAAVGLTTPQFAILGVLYYEPEAGYSISELAEILVLDRSALGHNLKVLVRDGLVALVESPKDRRVHIAVLTVSGKAKYRQAKKAWDAAQKRVRQILGVPGSESLRKQLEDIAKNPRLGRLKD